MIYYSKTIVQLHIVIIHYKILAPCHKNQSIIVPIEILFRCGGKKPLGNIEILTRS